MFDLPPSVSVGEWGGGGGTCLIMLSMNWYIY